MPLYNLGNTYGGPLVERDVARQDTLLRTLREYHLLEVRDSSHTLRDATHFTVQVDDNSTHCDPEALLNALRDRGFVDVSHVTRGLQTGTLDVLLRSRRRYYTISQWTQELCWMGTCLVVFLVLLYIVLFMPNFLDYY